MLNQLRQQFAELDTRITAIENRVNRGRNAHFESLAGRSECIFSRSLRDASHYASRRAGRGVSEFTVYDPGLDALKVIIPPLQNELLPYGLQYVWQNDWSIGQTIVVQIDQMITRAMRELIPTPGSNGRSQKSYKFTNITTAPRNAIFVELRPAFRDEPGVSHVDFRHYGQLLEGLTDRDAFACDPIDPAYIGPRKQTHDSHPGPDSTSIRNRPLPHPHQFKILDDTWVRATYEIERIAEGCRIRIWLADENHGPSLIVCSPTDPSRGFLSAVTSRPNGFYLELDGSQETTYAAPQPERAAYFRNLVVLQGVRGDAVLGGRPSR